MKLILRLTLLSLFLPFLFINATPQDAQTQSIEFGVETGGVFFSGNDVRIPNEGGTKFDMLELIGTDLNPYLRLSAAVTLGERHRIGLLYAPLSVDGSGTFASDVFFEDATFAAGEPIRGTYQFSNYRLSYRYMFFRNERWDLGAGFTAFIRDAKVQLEQQDISEKNTDLGFVPLVSFYADYQIGGGFSATFDVEALAGQQGRAADGALTLNYKPAENIRVSAGYRLLEGGADVDEVYNFAWINYLKIGVRYTL